jgi:lysozyme family protein
MIDLARLKAANAARWAAMHVEPALGATLDRVAGRLIEPAAKARYEIVSAQTSVPWFIVAVIHEREASQSWAANLAQGDPWNAVSLHVPKGQGPFHSWESAAVNALERCAPYAAHWADWSVGGALTLLEEYNGLGYAQRGVASPYIWAGTDQYRSGKYIADGHYDPHAIDHQLGCAALLARMAIFDQSVTFGEGASS